VIPALGALGRRWWLIFVPLLGWPLFYAGLNRGWWGNGTGDGWEHAAVFFTCVGAITTAIAIASARSLARS
jgi:hypothetical protein